MAPVISPSAPSSLQTILAQFCDDARNNPALGGRFERMMQQFFRADPLYAGLFSEVWLWNEWPKKGQVGDVGIDLLLQHKAICFLLAQMDQGRACVPID